LNKLDAQVLSTIARLGSLTKLRDALGKTVGLIHDSVPRLFVYMELWTACKSISGHHGVQRSIASLERDKLLEPGGDAALFFAGDSVLYRTGDGVIWRIKGEWLDEIIRHSNGEVLTLPGLRHIVLAAPMDAFDKLNADDHARRVVNESYFEGVGIVVAVNNHPCFKVSDEGRKLAELSLDDLVDRGRVTPGTDKKPAAPPDGRTTDAEPVAQVEPSHARAKALYYWAIEHIVGAENMTYAELFRALTIDPRCAGEGLPSHAATFARYCRAAGVQRNRPRSTKGATRSVRRSSQL